MLIINKGYRLLSFNAMIAVMNLFDRVKMVKFECFYTSNNVVQPFTCLQATAGWSKMEYCNQDVVEDDYSNQDYYYFLSRIQLILEMRAFIFSFMSTSFQYIKFHCRSSSSSIGRVRQYLNDDRPIAKGPHVRSVIRAVSSCVGPPCFRPKDHCDHDGPSFRGNLTGYPTTLYKSPTTLPHAHTKLFSSFRPCSSSAGVPPGELITLEKCPVLADDEAQKGKRQRDRENPCSASPTTLVEARRELIDGDELSACSVSSAAAAADR